MTTPVYLSPVSTSPVNCTILRCTSSTFLLYGQFIDTLKIWNSPQFPTQLYATPKVTKYQRCNFIIQIHKFTVKIDTISINLLFECVKFVEFNFTSHVFLVMYQEILFVNQDVCFLNQEERRQFLIISVSERDWKREHKLEFKMASNRFYIPNVY